MKQSFFCSWSGGKDSCLSLYLSIKSGYECASLFTMIDESGKYSRSHGLTPETLSFQAKAMGIPHCTVAASWAAYEQQFKDQTVKFRERGVLHGVFGDIDLEPHREWVTRVCNETGITAHLPLWKESRRKLVEEFLEAGFKAVIVVVNTSMMPERFLGRTMDRSLIDELESEGVDACGENGEFHTFVYDGPLFRQPLLVKQNAVIRSENYVFLSIKVSG